MGQFKCRISMALLMGVFAGICVDPITRAEALQDKLSSPYRFVMRQVPTADFDPNEDILQPSRTQEAVEEIRRNILGSMLRALVPISGQLFRAGSNVTLLELQTACGLVQKSLGEQLRSLKNTSQLPTIRDDFYLIPWDDKRSDLFYDSEKISMSADEYVNVFAISVSKNGGGDKAKDFASRLTDNIQSLRNVLRTSTQPASLLSLAAYTTISNREATAVVQILVRLRPSVLPPPAGNEQVTFKNLVIPEIEGKDPVALLTTEIDLTQQNPTPSLKVVFGDFKLFASGVDESTERGRFFITGDHAQKSTPRLEGVVQRAQKIAVNFSFKELAFNLRTLQVSGLQTLVSPGLRIGSSNFVVGGFRIQSVNKQFEEEINKTIDSEIQTAIKKGSDSLANGLVKSALFEEVINTILGKTGVQQ